MKSILKEFALGNILTEPRFFTKDSHYGKVMKQLSTSKDKLLTVLGEEEKQILESYSEAQQEIASLSSLDQFIYGYRLGTLMTMEVFNGKDSLIIDEEDA